MSSAIPCFSLVPEEPGDVACCSNGLVLAVGAKHGELACSEGSTGKLMWRQQLGEAMEGEGGPATAFACTDNRLCYGVESKDGNFCVRILPLTGDGLDFTPRHRLQLARFTLAVRQIRFHPSLLLVGIASDDGKLYVQEIVASEDGSTTPGSRREYQGLKGGARSFSFDPLDEYFAASSLAGDLHIFSYANCKEVHKRHLWPPSIAGDGPRQGPEWQPGAGEFLALPATPDVSSIKLLKRGATWAEDSVLSGGHKMVIGSVIWTSCGEILISASEDSVTAWRPGVGLAPLWQCPPASKPYHMVMGKDANGANMLVVGMHNGSVSIINGSLENPPIATQHSNLEAEASRKQTDSELAPGEVGLEDETPVPSSELEDPAKEQQEEVEEANIPVQQGPVQPGATTRARRKFLAWNDHGIMRLYAAGEETTDTMLAKNVAKQPDRVEVEFSGRLKVIRDRAPDGLTLASLGPGVCAMAIGSDFLEERPGKVRVVKTDFAQPLFEKSLSPDEDVDAIAVARDYVVIATSKRFLQVMTLTGLPVGLMSLPGPVVMLVASDKMFLVIFHSAPPIGQDQCLSYWLVSDDCQTRLSVGQLPLSPGSTVKWAGFSTEALPMVLDSADMLRGLIRGDRTFAEPGGQGSWIPLLDLDAASSKASSWWPVRAEGTEILCAAVPKNSEPEAGPTYRLEAVKYRLPTCQGAGGGDENAEGAVLCERILSGHLAQALKEGSVPTPLRSAAETANKQRVDQGSKSALRLFGALIARGESEKALEVANTFLSSYDAHQTLLKDAEDYASKRNPDLSYRVGQLKRSFASISQI